MTPTRALLLLLVAAPFAASMPLDQDARESADYAAEADSYALARDAVAGDDYFPALTEPAEGEFVYERPPEALPAIVYFAEAPSLAQAPAGPAPLGPSKLANKVGEAPLPPPRRAPQPQPPVPQPAAPPARLVPALVLLLPSRGAASAPGFEPPRFRQLPPPLALPVSADDQGLDVAQPWPFLQAPLSRGPALPFFTDEHEVPEPATEIRPPPMPETDAPSVTPSEEPSTSVESDDSGESKEKVTSDEVTASKESTEAKTTEDKTTETESPSTTTSAPRSRRSPGDTSPKAGSNSKSSASSGASGSGSFSSASSQSSSFSEPVFFNGPTNSGSFASSSSQSSSHAGGGTGFAMPGFSATPGFGSGNFGAGSPYNPHPAGFGHGDQVSHGYNNAGGEGNLLNRFGSLDEPGPASVQHSGTSTGKGVHSSSSSSIDSTGKVTYHVQAGKF